MQALYWIHLLFTKHKEKANYFKSKSLPLNVGEREVLFQFQVKAFFEHVVWSQSPKSSHSCSSFTVVAHQGLPVVDSMVVQASYNISLEIVLKGNTPDCEQTQEA